MSAGSARPESKRVDATPADQLAYVFPAGAVGPTQLKLPIERYRQVAVAGYVLYLPQ